MRDAQRRAYALCETNDFERALPFAERALREHPEDFLSWCTASWAFHGANQFQRARDAAAEAVRLQPEQEWAHRCLARALQALGHRGDAMAAMRESVRLAPNEGRSWRQYAELAGVLGFPDEAETAARRTVELAPDQVWAWTTLGWALSRRDWDEAVDAYRRALELKPESAWAMYSLGWLLTKKDHFEEALDLIDRALMLSPSFTPPLFTRALITACLDSPEAGKVEYVRAMRHTVALYDAAIAKAPSEGLSYSRRARHLRYLGDERAALVSARTGAKLAPRTVEAWRVLGWIAANMGRHQLARYAIRRASANDPASPELWSDVAEIDWHAGKQNGAREWANRVVDEAPNCEWRPRADGILAYLDGDLHAAAAAYQKIVSADPYHCCYQSYLGSCLAPLGDIDGAQEALRKADLRTPNCGCTARQRIERAMSKST